MSDIKLAQAENDKAVSFKVQMNDTSNSGGFNPTKTNKLIIDPNRKQSILLLEQDMFKNKLQNIMANKYFYDSGAPTSLMDQLKRTLNTTYKQAHQKTSLLSLKQQEEIITKLESGKINSLVGLIKFFHEQSLLEINTRDRQTWEKLEKQKKYQYMQRAGITKVKGMANGEDLNN